MYKTMRERVDFLIKFTQGRCPLRMGMVDQAGVDEARAVLAQHENPWAKLVIPELITADEIKGRVRDIVPPAPQVKKVEQVEQIELEDVVEDTPAPQPTEPTTTPLAQEQSPSEAPASPPVKMKWVLQGGKMTQVPA